MKQSSFQSLKQFSPLPLGVMATLVAVFAILDIRVSLFSPLPFPVLQTLFVVVIYVIVAYLAAASFRRTGSWEILLFGATLLLYGTALMLAAWLSRWGGLNTNTTIHNTSALLGSIETNSIRNRKRIAHGFDCTDANHLLQIEGRFSILVLPWLRVNNSRVRSRRTKCLIF